MNSAQIASHLLEDAVDENWRGAAAAALIGASSLLPGQVQAKEKPTAQQQQQAVQAYEKKPPASVREIEKWKIPGEKQKDRCQTYAFCLNYLLFDKGIESKVLAYRWGPRFEDVHVIVLFNFNGKRYIIDNEIDKAEEARGNTEWEMIKNWDPTAREQWHGPTTYSAQVPKIMKELASARKKQKI